MQKEINWLLKEKYSNKPSETFNKDVIRLKAGEPLDYVIGFTDFLGCKIDLSKKSLIPRPETEYWVQKAISNISYEYTTLHKRKIKVLDIFAGSGCIGISIVRQINKAHITFAEKNPKFIKQIKINLRLNNIPKKRYNVIKSDIFNSVEGKFDYIFVNPPYISTTRKNKIQKSVLTYEPKMALLGGKDGLFYIRKFLQQASLFLNTGGTVYMEFDSIQKTQIEKLLKKYHYKKWEFYKDQYGKWRWVKFPKI